MEWWGFNPIIFSADAKVKQPNDCKAPAFVPSTLYKVFYAVITIISIKTSATYFVLLFSPIGIYHFFD